MELEFDDKIVNASYQLHPIKGSYSVDVSVELLVEVETFFVQVKIAFPSASGKFDKFISTTVSDLCKYYKNNNSNMFLRMFFNAHFKKTQFPTTCPIKPGLYFMEEFLINENLLKIRTVDTKLMLLVDFCTRSGSHNGALECFVNIKAIGEIKDRRKWEQEMAVKGK